MPDDGHDRFPPRAHGLDRAVLCAAGLSLVLAILGVIFLYT
ncbi:hypothetical protein OCGS_1737 [Oceaniovalibus guishaninsula JLT2003]|uniref:Uncharacterized protein n=1 Tax=Oceaniovalibus guishaninsula JLT2003 TaxID=1231392 RepID=K2GNK9_9RHOB|nr:hypothetical protein [Oceaniovalibus guishaninsula]EKE44221.1 hypothetical protein OCGS_1737 [Oceaniovalibus guishaninsula JLT2003]